MQRSTALALSLALLFATVSTTAPAQPSQDKGQEKQERKAIYDEEADAKAQIAAALAEAKKENRRVLIQWGANWCHWCHVLHDVFASDEDVRRKLLYEYDVVLVDVGKFDTNMELAKRYGADLKANGVPFLTVLDAEGKPLANRETGSLEAGDKHDVKKVLGFLEKHQAKYLKAEDLYADALKRAQTSNRAVFLHFGAPWCGWCHRLEDWMERPAVAKVMAKHFVDLKIDTDRTIGGADLLASYRGEGGGIPWWVFLNGEGDALAHSGIGDANLGCPWTDEELAGFGKCLKQAAPDIAEKDVAVLLGEMKAFREELEKKKREREAGD